MGSEYLSFSKLESYSTCQRRYWLEQNEPAPEPLDRTTAFALGRQVHTAMERLARGGRAGVDYDRALADLEHDPPAGPLSVPTLQDYARPAIPLLRLLNDPPTDMIELKRKDPRIKNSGRIDLVVPKSPGPERPEERPCVIDWKTGRPRFGENNIRRSVQLGLYCHMLDLHDAAFVYLDGVSASVVYAHLTEAEIADSVRWFVENSRAIRFQEPLGMGAFAMTSRESPLCNPRFCPYYGLCYPHGTATGK